MTTARRCSICSIACLSVLAAFEGGTGAAALAQAVRDDFAGTQISTDVWFPCRRPENELSIVPVADKGFNAARLLVHHFVPPAMLAAHPGCIADDGSFTPDNAERAELWEADNLKQAFGTDIWYRFAFYVAPPDPGLPVPRLVIGQWKETGSRSPFVAQRFTDRHFVVSIEQDNRSPNHAPDDTDCRIIVAHDASLPQAVSARAAGERDANVVEFSKQRDFLIGSFGHDARDLVHAEPSATTGKLPSCASDLAITNFGLLPPPFGGWITMTYHIKAGITDGLVEIWANDSQIVTVKGRIGYADLPSDKQYFKFGPYRDSVSYDDFAMLAAYRRGPTRAGVEP